jgi:hypothetical protein
VLNSVVDVKNGSSGGAHYRISPVPAEQYAIALTFQSHVQTRIGQNCLPERDGIARWKSSQY